VNRNEDHWHVCRAALFLKLHVTFRFGIWNKVERLGSLISQSYSAICSLIQSIGLVTVSPVDLYSDGQTTKNPELQAFFGPRVVSCWFLLLYFYHCGLGGEDAV
jgi:hypothetical protein